MELLREYEDLFSNHFYEMKGGLPACPHRARHSRLLRGDEKKAEARCTPNKKETIQAKPEV